MEELEQIKKDYEKALEEGVNSEKEVFNVERLPSQLNSWSPLLFSSHSSASKSGFVPFALLVEYGNGCCVEENKTFLRRRREGQYRTSKEMLVGIGVVPDGQRPHYEVEKGRYGTVTEANFWANRVVRSLRCAFMVVLRKPNRKNLFPQRRRLQSLFRN